MKKKAQVAIFFIIGIVILIAASLIFYINSTSQREEIAPGVFVSVQEIPVELGPVNSLITQCLDDVATRGLILIGEHGGYIDVNDFELTKQSFKISQNPTQSELVAFTPGSDLKIPYWWYMESDNKCEGVCQFTSKRPPLRDAENSIEKQLDRYIERELPGCLDNFNSLKEQGFTINELSSIKANTKVAESDVVVVLDYKLEVIKQDVSSNLNQFFVRTPVNLQKIYNLATGITNMQQKYRFLERQTMNLISGFASIDETKLPPISELRFEFGSSTVWTKSDVKSKISQLLSSYISLFQVDGTRNFDRNFYSTELSQRLYDSMIIPVADRQYNNLDVAFNYLHFWPIYFDLNCNGEICEAESASSNLLAFIGLQRYNFVYDVSFPVFVEIFDEAALDNRGYKFNFFLESNIRNNEELKTNFIPLKSVQLEKNSLLCDLENRNSADVTIKAFDSVSSEPLDDVGVTLTVADESCFIGTTDENGELTAKLPTGTAGAVLTLLKRDYISEFQLFDASNEEKSLEGVLKPIAEKKVIVKKRLLEKTENGWTFTNAVSDLDPKEEALVSMTRISPLTEEEFSTFASLQGPNEEDIRLAPGKYEVHVDMLLRDNLRIPEKKIKKKVGLFKKIEFTMPGISFNETNPYPSGGLRLNVTITEEDLKKDTLVLFAVNPALDKVPEAQRSLEDLDQIARIDDYSNVYGSLLKPAFQ